MHWIARSEKDTAAATLEKRLWDAAKQAVPAPLSRLKSQKYSGGCPQGPARGVEKTDETGRLCRMVPVRKDLADHGLEGDPAARDHGGVINIAHHFPSA